MVDIAHEIAAEIERVWPRIVLTHPYEGGHPDHDATALGVHLALDMLADHDAPVPALLEFASYHVRDGRLAASEFLPAQGCREIDIVLSAPERDLKRDLIACHASQRETISRFPVDVERFRVAPRYDFAQPPHPGKLFYELFDWGMTGDRFRALAADAVKTVRGGLSRNDACRSRY
jgi:LmbE family N-acetylglucosaminyl deacetylase